MSSPIDATRGPRITGPTPVATAKPAQAPAQSTSTPADASAGDDTVQLTGDAMQINDIAAAVARTPVVDIKRVAEVKQAISNGKYAVDVGALASKLLAFDSRLGA